MAARGLGHFSIYGYFDQGHPKTTCISEKYYSNLANGFVEKIYKEIGPIPWRPCFFRYHHEFKKLAREPTKDYLCLISFLSGQWFQKRIGKKKLMQET